MNASRAHAAGPLLVVVGIASAVLLAGCHSAGLKTATPLPTQAPIASPSTSPTASATTAASPTASLPPGAEPGTDDYNDDGIPDPTCSTQDFGAGLKVRVICQLVGAHAPESGTQLVTNSLYRLPGEDIDLTGISGEMVVARDPAGNQLHILIFNSDELFPTGSDAVHSADTLNATVALINAHFPNGQIQVRGHTDSTGSRAANQALSQRRAEHVRAYLLAHGAKAASITAAGLGSSQPLTEETNANGSVSVAGRAFNRRVEIVIRLPR